AKNLVTFGVVLPAATYPGTALERRVQFVSELQNRIKAMPGVQAVTTMQGLPPQRPVNANDTEIEGAGTAPTDPAQNIDYYQNAVTGYFEAMKLPIVSGRGFESADVVGPPVVVVNEAMASRFYPKVSAVGRRI